MKNAFATIIFFITVWGSAFAASTIYPGGGGKITASCSFSLKLSGISTKSIHDTFGIEAVCIKVTHKDLSKLSFYLQSPDGTQIKLFASTCTGKKLDSTIFSDTGAMFIQFAKPSYRNNFKPEEPLKALNNKQNPNGTWKLNVTDGYTPAGSGTLVSWYMVLGNHPAWDVKLKSSSLPIIIINTSNKTIISGTKIKCKYYAIDNGPGKWNFTKDSMKFLGYAGIDIRGSSSSSFPKKSYGFETWDASSKNLDVPLLGMPKDNDWALIANYTDKTLMRNFLSYKYQRELGHYAPRTRMAELIVNGVYQGVYLVCEKIKVAKNRVNIAKITPTALKGDSLTGGYIFKIDKFTGSVGGYWKSVYPVNGSDIYYQDDDPSTLPTTQQNYIKKYVDSFEKAIKSGNLYDTVKGWRHFAYEADLIDFFIIDELSKNVDGYRLSTFIHKDRGSRGGKIHAGPQWDFDLSWGNANYYNGQFGSGWEYNSTPAGDGFQPPCWWTRLVVDTSFKTNLKCRWTILRKNTLSDAAILGDIDSVATALKEPAFRNFNQWPELGTYVWPEPHFPPTFQQEIDSLKNWTKQRTKWLDKYMPGTCRIDFIAPTVKLIDKDTAYLQVFNHYVDSGITYNDNRDGKNVIINKGTNLDSNVLGHYIYFYEVSDKSGNKTTVYRTIIVIDTIKPQIVFNGKDTILQEVLMLFNDTTANAIDNYYANVIANKIGGNFNFKNNIPDSLGLFVITYQATDGSGNSVIKNRYIKVIDTLSPIITMLGKDTELLEVFHAFNEPGVSAKDNFDTGITITYTGNFNMKNPLADSLGLFFITYSATDKSGNKSTKTRYILIIDTIPSIIKLKGSDSVIIMQDSVYIDSGYTVTDNYDKHPKVDTITSLYNTHTPGRYAIAFQATDQSNNSASITRIIDVLKNVGIDARKPSFQISLTPNPSTGEITITTSSLNLTPYSLSLYSSLGQKIEGVEAHGFHSNKQTFTFPKSCPSGIYFLKIQTPTQTITKQIILQR